MLVQTMSPMKHESDAAHPNDATDPQRMKMFTFPLFLLSPDAPLLLLLLLLLPVIVLLQVELALPSRRLQRGDPEVAISTDILMQRK